MAQLSYNDYLEMTRKNNNTEKKDGNKSFGVGYFSLKNDGEMSIVRFNIEKADDIKLYNVHSINPDGKYRTVNCLRTKDDGKEKCPLCNDGQKPFYKIYIPLIEYTVENDSIKASAKMWSTSARFREVLNTYIMDYGDLRNQVFKVIRHGAAGTTKVDYQLMPCNPQIYTAEKYVPNFEAFNNLKMSWFVMDKSADEMRYYLEKKTFNGYGDGENTSGGNTQESITERVQESYTPNLDTSVEVKSAESDSPFRNDNVATNQPTGQYNPRRYAIY